ncbi:uracil-DNA glycosylase family protein [Ferrimonas aestuarii]|uniref:Uracil-DNA glycosylase family protein n=1 Tax=Ferrimonas aestuarii TaxID=2569539 RepID=A0A4U1BM96_9GAMM|nr:uracil-DNA glycosylase family protein [Ferrimonas aestuarii]TKB53692.1 uracil-DNA glycosylase family protein [Ferrimonas aestuarii]
MTINKSSDLIDTSENSIQLNQQVSQCQICRAQLPLEPRPILQWSDKAKLLIIGQAPGLRAHDKRRPFDDPSGDRLRHWLNMDKTVFYDPQRVAIIPMGFCYPGKGKSGDQPPRPECARRWHQPLQQRMTDVKLTILLGQYAQKAYLPDFQSVTQSGLAYLKQPQQEVLALPHPSPRNNLWLKRNPWFDAELLPLLKQQLSKLTLSD